MKKLLLILCVVLFAVAAGTVGVSALLTAKDQSMNHLTAANNTIEVVETFAPPENISPGTDITKYVTVKNTDGAQCYVRIRPVFSDESFLDYLNIDYQEAWIYSEEDDFYYYPVALKEEEISTPLFTHVFVREDVTAEEASSIQNLSIYIYAESCQKGNAENYISAWEEMEKNQGKE